MKNTSCPICNNIISDIEHTDLCPQCGWEVVVIPKNASQGLKQHFKNKIDIHKSLWEEKTNSDILLNEKIKEIERIENNIKILAQEKKDLEKLSGINDTKIDELQTEIDQKKDIIDSLNKEKDTLLLEKNDEIKNIKKEKIDLEKKLKAQEKEIQELDTRIKNKTNYSYLSEYNKEKKKSRNYLYGLFASCAVLCIIVILGYFYYNSITKYQESILSENKKLKEEKSTMTSKMQKEVEDLNKINSVLSNQIKTKDDQIKFKDIQIITKDSEIASLKTQLPQLYQTKYANQSLYYKCSAGWYELNCQWPKKNTSIYIYTQKEGYGLTDDGGWIPMSRLQKF